MRFILDVYQKSMTIISTIFYYIISLKKIQEINKRSAFTIQQNVGGKLTSFKSDKRYDVHSFVQHITNDEEEGIQLRITCLTVAPLLSLLNSTSDNYSPATSFISII